MIHSRGNRFQDFFEDDRYTVLKNHLYNYLLRRVAIDKVLENERPDKVLEVGTGMSPTVFVDERVVYTDVSFLAMQTLRMTLRKGEFVVADGINLPFRSRVFSHVVSSEVLEHIEDDRSVLREIARVTRPAGSLIITFPHRQFYFSHDDRFVKHFRRYELSEMEQLLKEAGFDTLVIRKVLGPLEKITMHTVTVCISIIQRLSGKDRMEKQKPRPAGIVIKLFQWVNRLYAGLAWVDAHVAPRALATVLLIRAKKNE